MLKPWFGPWERNPQLCKNCMKALTKQGVGGAEVEISMLFVDIRGSTGLAERLGPAAFAALRVAGVTVPLFLGGAAITDADHALRLGADHWTGRDGRTAVEVVERVLSPGHT